MSLINDALKQARQAQPKAAAPASGPTMRPVERACRPEEGQGFLLPSLIAVALLVGGVSIWEGIGASNGAPKVSAHAPIPTLQPAIPAAESRSIPTPQVSPSVSNTVPADAAAPGPAATPATNTVAPVEQPKPAPLVYKLQGIFYQPNNPSAVINGKPVFPGSRVGDATVVAITQDSATIVTLSGRTNVLELAERVR